VTPPRAVYADDSGVSRKVREPHHASKRVDIGRQTVKRQRTRHCSKVREGSALWQQAEQSARYLSKMKELCFNSLAHDHQVAACRDPTKCWRCHRSVHISTNCAPHCHNITSTRPTIIPSPLPCSTSNCSNLDPRFTLTHNSSGTGTIVDDDLLHIRHNSPITVRERLLDPMLLEALLMNQRSNAGWSSSPSPSSTATPQLIINHHFPTKEIKTPKLLRSEEEHMVGQELIKALGSFKHMFVGPCLPNKTLHLGRNQVWCVCKALIASISIEISKSSLERQPSRLSTIY
jgi:hypothetical protein